MEEFAEKFNSKEKLKTAGGLIEFVDMYFLEIISMISIESSKLSWGIKYST